MIPNETINAKPKKVNGWALDPNQAKPSYNSVFKTKQSEYGMIYPPGYTRNDVPTIKVVQEKKQSRVRKNIVQQLEKYCENTTLHGLRYVGDSQLTIGERIFWFISFSLAICFAAYYISNIYAKWKSSPVIISFSPFDAELSSIPFPAITICNMNQAKKNEAERILKEGTSIERKLLDDSCSGNTTFDNSENISWEALRDFLVKVGNSCSDMLQSCQWGMDKLDCNEIFNNDLSDEGLCCSFNRLPPDMIFKNSKDISILNQTYPSNVHDWDPEKGFTSSDNGDSIPKRPLGAGAHLGLSVILDANIDNYYCSSTRSTGFKIILSNPIETPKMADFGFLVSPGFETRISIEPSIREATSALREIPIEKRQCFFANERPLQYYRKYTKSHCDIECRSVNSYRQCGCVPHHIPHYGEVKTCSLNSRCMERIQGIMEQHPNMKPLIKEKSVDCNCLYSCISINYGYSKTFSPLNGFFVPNKTSTDVRTYTQANCFYECQSNYTFKNCFCVPFYLPKSSYVNTCDRSDDNCISSIKRSIEDLKDGSFLDGECGCKPGCFELIFGFKWTSSPVWSHMLQNTNITENRTSSIAVVHFFFGVERYQKSVKSLLYGFSEILSNFGGILSLCLGISFLSIVESYTQRSCILECQSNYTLNNCQCVPYYLPKDKTIKYCGKTEKSCVDEAKRDMEMENRNGSSCHCLPSCFSVKYSESKSIARLAPKLSSDFPNLSSNYIIKNLAVLQFYFYNSKFTKEMKSELYGFTEILSNVGGLLSLCLGFSFLSLIELVYFLTIRISCDLVKHNAVFKRKIRKRKAPYPFLR